MGGPFDLEKPIDLALVRRNKQWVADARLVVPILNAIEQATPAEKKEKLFWAACRLRDLIYEGVVRRHAAVRLLRGSAGIDIPSKEADRIIAAGLYPSRA
jgi:hypothetical protein